MEEARNSVVSHGQSPRRFDAGGTLAQGGPEASRRGPLPGALADLALVAACVAVVLAALPFVSHLPPMAAMALFALGGAMALARLGRFHPYPRFGLANGLTMVRAGGAAVFLALALEPGLVAGHAGWMACAAVGLLLALDGLDGFAARRQGLTSAFGARFDMEVDAALILALAALSLGLGKAGPWVLGLGLARYAFVAAGWLMPALARPLPPSRRRSAVCVLQVAVLGLLLAPPVVPPASVALAAVAFVALATSFAIDIAWLARRTR